MAKFFDRFRRPHTLEEQQLMAWHILINSDNISVYTFEGGVEHRRYVNPKLAWRRVMGEHMEGIAEAMGQVRAKMYAELLPAFEKFSADMKAFADKFDQLRLEARLPIENRLD